MSENKLTSQQAADVIQYFHNGENREARKKGRKDKVSLAKAAMHAVSRRHSLLPEKTPMLTYDEMSAGIEYIENPPRLKSDEYYNEAERRVDLRGFSYDDAYRELDSEGWE